MVTTLRRAAKAETAESPQPGFGAVAQEHLDDVYRYLLYFTRNPTVAEDLTGETFERALRAWHRFDPRRGAAKTWLCQIARSAALDHLRAESRRTRREGSYAREQVVETEAPFGDGLSPALERALGRLSAGEREVVALRVLLELDGDTAAHLLGITPTACSTRLSRALHKLEETIHADA